MTTLVRVLAVALALSLASGCDLSPERSVKDDQKDVHVSTKRDVGVVSNSALPAEQALVEAMSGDQLLAIPHPALMALSASEAAWLDRHGYPTAEELAEVQFLDVAALEDATRNRRDKRAAALLGHRRAMDGDLSGAIAAFSAGSHLGSLYARQQLALHAAHRQTGLAIEELESADQGSLGVMIAELEVARLLGDHQAQVLIDKFSQKFYWDLFGEQVQEQVRILMDQYGEYTRARGERSIGPDPRPNAEQWARLRNAPGSELVTVYTRGRSL